MDRILSNTVENLLDDSAPSRLVRRLSRGATAVFERATVRHGCAEHEWLGSPGEDGGDFEQGAARMLVLADRCMVSTDDTPVEVELVICRGQSDATVDLLYRVPAGSWLAVDDAWDWPLFDADGDEHEARARIELPDGRVRITARLERGGRLCARLSNAKA